MELLNATRMQAAYTMGTEPSAREHLLVAAKGTFAYSNLQRLTAEDLPAIKAATDVLRSVA